MLLETKSKYPTTDLSNEFYEKMKASTNNYSEVTCKSYNHNFRQLCNTLSITTSEELLANILTGQQLINTIDAMDKTPSIKYNIKKIIPCAYRIFSSTELPADISALYSKHMMNYNRTYMQQIHSQKVQERLPLYSDFLDNVLGIYGEDSQQYLICSLYKELTCRDDFSQLLITPAYKRSISTFNYIVVRPHHPVEVILNQYKTCKKYGEMRVTLTTAISRKIKKYINQNNIQYGDYLFPQSRLSGVVSSILQRCGLQGGISTLRRMIISEHYSDPDKSDDEHEELARRMCHHPMTAVTVYMRDIVPSTSPALQQPYNEQPFSDDETCET